VTDLGIRAFISSSFPDLHGAWDAAVLRGHEPLMACVGATGHSCLYAMMIVSPVAPPLFISCAS